MDLGIPATTIVLLCLANLTTLLFDLAFLVDWIRNWRYVKVYWAYGIGAGLGEMLFAILMVGAGILAALSDWRRAVPPGWESSAPPSGEGAAIILLLLALFIIIVGLLALVVGATQLGGVTMLGMHYADALGHPSFPLLRRLFGPRPSGIAGQALPALAGAADDIAITKPPVAQRKLRGDYALSTLGVVAAAALYSVVLFRLTSPRLSEVLAGLPGYTPERVNALTPPALLIALVTALSAAFSEELLYRLGIQGFLARYLNCRGSKYWIPVVLASLIWTLQHVGTLEPGWVKLAQIFPIGLMLGWLYRRHGVESCMLAHGLFNVALMPLSSFLIGK